MKSRIGVYTCHCGLNIAKTVDVEAVTEFARRLPNVVVARNYTYMCSDPGQALITQDIRELGLTHVVVASCSPRMHEPTFRGAIQKAGLNPYCLEMANIREQCSWVHPERESATEKAQDLIASAVAKVAWLVPLQEREAGVTQAALVIGGGIAGMQAALDIADADFKVYLVERQAYLGGRTAQLNTTFPTLEKVSDMIAPLVENVLAHPNIKFMPNADVKQVDGFIGNFSATIVSHPRYVDPDKCTACGKCDEACPVRVRDEYNASLTERRSIYQLPSTATGHSGGKIIGEPGRNPAPYFIDERNCTFAQDRLCTPVLGQDSQSRSGESGGPESVSILSDPSLSPLANEGRRTANGEPYCVAACPEHAIDLTREEESIRAQVGAIIVATGAAAFDAKDSPELGFGNYPNVVTSLQFERIANPVGPTHGKILVDGKEPRDVVFVQCVGSRDQTKGNPYCSRVCCMVAAKQALLIKKEIPQANVSVLYADVRAFGKGFEEFYDDVRKSGVRYRRGYVSEVIRNGDKLCVRAEDTLIRKPIEVPADLVVLGIGLKPRVETNEIASLLGLTRSADGFLAESHPKLRPVDTMVDGVYLAGTCQGPKDIVESISQAKAAASSALAPLCSGRVKIESATSFIDQELCAGCGLCAAACAYGALTLNERTQRMAANSVLCKGCGACAAACPSKAIQVMQSTPRQMLSQIAALA